MKRLTTLTISVLCCLYAFSAVPKMRYNSFSNLDGQTKMIQVRALTQDNDGLIWFGSPNGLFCYDGYDIHRYGNCNRINSLCTNGDTLIVASGETLHIFDLRQRKYSEDILFKFGGNVSDMKYFRGKLWIASETGLYIYDNSGIREIELQGAETMKTINVLDSDGSHLYIGGFSGLWSYAFDTGEIVQYALNSVTALAYDKMRECLWAGSYTNFYQLNPEDGQYTDFGGFPVVKNLTIDNSENVILGTDDGLYIYNGSTFKHISHDAKDDKSLAGQAVWASFKDRDDNIWLGFDNGISLSINNKALITIRLSTLTNSSVGNEISSMTRDAAGNVWLGGNRGAITMDKLEELDSPTRWFRMDNTEYFIPHNHVSNIFQDADGRLFLLSDAGILSYDFNRQTFTCHVIREEHFSRWAYDMCEGDDGSYWVATYGGIFNISGDFTCQGEEISALAIINEKDGLPNNNVKRIERTSDGRLVVMSNSGEISIVDIESESVDTPDLTGWLSGSTADCMIKDSDENIWICSGDRLLKMSPDGTEIVATDLNVSADKSYAMAEAKGYIWIATSSGLVSLNKKTLKVLPVGITERFMSIYYDKKTDRLWLGTADKISVLSPDNILLDNRKGDIRISSVFSNGKDEIDYAKVSSGRFTLNHRQNNLSVNFTDFDYGKSDISMFKYRCYGTDAEWKTLPAGENTIQLHNLSPGKYSLYIINSITSLGDSQIKPVAVFRIFAPWYFCTFAKFLYFILFVAGVWKVLYDIESGRRIEEEKKQSRAKVVFLTDVAHELKTPLSLIMAPLGTMMSGDRNPEDRKMLDIMHTNALKLSQMINQSIEIYRGNGNLPEVMSISEIEVVEFIRSIFMSYSEDKQYLKKEYVFDSDRNILYTKVDVQKMESIVSNLISNASKYTPDGGCIMLTLSYASGRLVIKISDTGVGIPEQELPFIFQRYYQSSRTTRDDKTGTGVGLSIVKTYVEQMGGLIEVQSSSESGTTFMVSLPAEETRSCPSEVQNIDVQEDNRPLAVVVEDNLAVSEMICEILSGEWKCVTAHNGRNGLKLCQEMLPDLIVTDIMMPVMDGLEMCRKIRAIQSMAATPIILLTAKDDTDLELKSAGMGIDSFIPKPFEPALLEARARQLFQSRNVLKKQARIDSIATPTSNGETSQDEQFLIETTKVIESRLDDTELTVNALSEAVKTSPKQLYRKIKQLTGLSPVEYIRSIRIKKAALLFQGGKFTVAEVMYMVGFSSPSYFSSCFAKEFGMTPKDYISNNR